MRGRKKKAEDREGDRGKNEGLKYPNIFTLEHDVYNYVDRHINTLSQCIH